MRGRRRGQHGFTLIELSIVVAIIGILAVIAVIGYRKYTLYTKISEAQAIVGAIKIAQEDYRAERGLYADLGNTWCPAAAGVSNKKVGWDTQCGTPKWETLPVHVEGAVQFQYQTVAGPNTFSGASVTWVTWGTPNATVPWFIVHAKCDLDGDGAGVSDTELAASNFSNQIFSTREGQ